MRFLKQESEMQFLIQKTGIGTAISDFCFRKQHSENQKSTGLESYFESSKKDRNNQFSVF